MLLSRKTLQTMHIRLDSTRSTGQRSMEMVCRVSQLVVLGWARRGRIHASPLPPCSTKSRVGNTRQTRYLVKNITLDWCPHPLSLQTSCWRGTYATLQSLLARHLLTKPVVSARRTRWSSVDKWLKEGTKYGSRSVVRYWLPWSINQSLDRLINTFPSRLIYTASRNRSIDHWLSDNHCR